MNNTPYTMPPQAPMNQPPMMPAPKPPKKKKPKAKAGVIAAIVIAATTFVSLFALVAGLGVYAYLQNTKKVTVLSNINPNMINPSYETFYEENNDLRGSISISDYGSFFVVQSEDNEKYIKRGFYGDFTSYGIPFFDYRNSIDTLDRNTIVYIPRNYGKDLFGGKLEKYRTINEFSKAPVIVCNTIYEDYKWFVYAVFITNSKPEDDNGYVFDYTRINMSESEFVEYIGEIDKRKLYDTGVDINSSDKILTISTSCDDFDDARLVVVARLQREGESVSVDTSKAYENPNPKYPQKWYDVNGKTNPYTENY